MTDSHAVLIAENADLRAEVRRLRAVAERQGKVVEAAKPALEKFKALCRSVVQDENYVNILNRADEDCNFQDSGANLHKALEALAALGEKGE